VRARCTVTRDAPRRCGRGCAARCARCGPGSSSVRALPAARDPRPPRLRARAPPGSLPGARPLRSPCLTASPPARPRLPASRRIVEAATQFRLVEPRRAHELAADAQRTLRDWAELRQRSGLRAADRARARAEAGAIFGSLQRAAGGAARGAHGGLADALAHADIAHLRPAARRGADAPLADAHAREHRAMSRLAELDAEAGAAARKATAGLRARAEARS
jgi:hypothetical protein